MSQNELTNLLKLTPLTDPPLNYAQFLMELKDHLERADTAPALILRAIKAMGEEKIEDEKDPERRQFLMTLRDVGIPSLLAFKHVCGSQRFALSMLNFLAAAAANGAQLKKMMIVEGGPGAGKDFFGDGIEQALERGASVYAVKGCPDHENPINLLKLLSEDQLKQLAEVTGLGNTLFDILAVAGDPCQHCYTTVKGTLAEPKEHPSLEGVEVEAIHVSKRSAGVSEWKPGENCSLIAALRRGNRGFVSLPDAFIKRELKPGEADERLILLDATQYRRLPAASDGCSDAAAASPLDAFLMATTNAKALSEFLNTLPDKDAFTGRSTLLKFPYNLVRVEEIRAYMQEMSRYKVLAKFDPLALKMIATLAVISRYAVPKEGEPFMHPIDRLRLLQGEPIQVKARAGSEWSTVWSTGGSSAPRNDGYGSGFGGYGSSSSKPASSETANYGPEAMPIPADVAITAQLMWRLIGKDEGLQGLDMRFMLGLLSQINEIGLKSKHKCVSALEAIMLLRSAIQNSLSTSNLTDGQKAILKRCQKWLGGEVTPTNDWNKSATDRPEVIEAEYRRLLKQQVLQVFCADYDAQAQGLYDAYRAHASGWAQGDKTVKVKGIGMVPVDSSILDDLDRYRLGKSSWSTISDDEKKFRNALETLLDEAREKFIGENLPKDVELTEEQLREQRIEIIKRFRESWETIPELANAIRAKLDEKVGKAVEKLLTTEVTSDLTDIEQEQLAKAKQTMTDMGYCEALQKPVLEYAKRVKVWAFKA